MTINNEHSAAMREVLEDVVREYLHWRKVNPHIKGGENYLKRLRGVLTPQPQSPIITPAEIKTLLQGEIREVSEKIKK